MRTGIFSMIVNYCKYWSYFQMLHNKNILQYTWMFILIFCHILSVNSDGHYISVVCVFQILVKMLNLKRIWVYSRKTILKIQILGRYWNTPSHEHIFSSVWVFMWSLNSLKSHTTHSHPSILPYIILNVFSMKMLNCIHHWNSVFI